MKNGNTGIKLILAERAGTSPRSAKLPRSRKPRRKTVGAVTAMAARSAVVEPPAEPLVLTDFEKPSVPSPAHRSTNGYDGNTALTLYMREVGQVRLLTAAEETDLAIKIKKGNAKAREMMIRANLRLVVKIARE